MSQKDIEVKIQAAPCSKCLFVGKDNAFRLCVLSIVDCASFLSFVYSTVCIQIVLRSVRAPKIVSFLFRSMYLSVCISVKGKCIPVFVFPNNFLFSKCISDTYSDICLEIYFSINFSCLCHIFQYVYFQILFR